MNTHPLHPLRAVTLALALLLASSAAMLAQASVVITGTRVIYPGDAREKTVQMTNQDAFPNVVQAWIDVGDPASTPDTAKAPFLINPAVSRMAPGSGQTLRILFTGSGLPQDRESLFYLNVLQIPPRNVAKADRNQMLVMLRNRLKLFYRPAGIPGSPEQLPEKLNFSLVQSAGGWRVRVENPTGFHASFGSATLSVGERQWTLRTSIVPPHSTAEWTAEKPAALPVGTPRLHALLINDYGARVDVRHDLPR
ncbi:molecular chaperone [Pseudomonas sp. ZM23]|uniref:Molecular chaperone n=1 Tax=Pseudomonas triclosanedens TaxID=2961893 RepID=A0ABY7A0W4_9PSED|nr:molecular chaperone [Pseudomonas triclosanedens]MCP8464668.1 molecular chaperone [Pseudomonas triclosanedens]MCP8473599.1 molecular chaperone [Pseudomonas triclosanedens]MCP8478436.1 molecular chaperone [Pseudomonas triclosanedens]WAI50852.1 molecular chaperone [Pseudomonas triclosanedens]